MSFSDTETFANKTVNIWSVGSPLPDLTKHAVKLAINPYDDDLGYKEYFEEFLKLPNIAQINTLILGSWGEAYEESSKLPIELLVQSKESFPVLTDLFIGDLALEEAEVSWIQQSDISPIYQAFPKLKQLVIRGSEGLSLGNISHAHIESLILETGGLGKDVLEQVRLARLPELSHLELWLGDDNYGCDITANELSAFLTGLADQFPKLTYLGLRNYHLTNDLAKLIAEKGVPQSLHTLDLSLGVLTDVGAEALLNSDQLPDLDTLDLHYHYLSDAMMKRVAESKLAKNINISDQEVGDEYDGEIERYIFVAE